MINKSYVNYGKYGKCYELSAGGVVMRITVDLGPRIIYLSRDNQENLLNEDIDDNVNKGGEFFDTNYHKGEKWHIYGGHRLWKAPEDLASYAPDNYPVEVVECDGGASFISAVEKVTGIRKKLTITITDNGEITIEHSFTNCGSNNINVALWALTVMNKGGTCYIPLSTEETGLLANRNLVIWSYTNIKDERIDLRQNALVVRQDPNATSNIKLGLCNTEGKAYYLRGDLMLEKFLPKADRSENYPDMVCSTECYTSNLILEVESISPVYEIKPNESKTHIERWILHNSKSPKYAEIKKEILL